MNYLYQETAHANEIYQMIADLTHDMSNAGFRLDWVADRTGFHDTNDPTVHEAIEFVYVEGFGHGTIDFMNDETGSVVTIGLDLTCAPGRDTFTEFDSDDEHGLAVCERSISKL